ncbi:hypothetical protein BDP27DRAFT_1429006 [Rhodocollybia butyracea]|uniref:RNA helicase n=1 Tax=Rhodocollybia butyracea TaxID=206335 RepID=A0A9P5TZD1_9AGAR|nr:hypothetical protein BDP27DRAFT_1429006 [Rhodocollybia butyracea]
MDGTAIAKDKTKAKQWYLKQKKEWQKINKNKKPEKTGDGDNGEDDEDPEPDADAAEEEEVAVEVALEKNRPTKHCKVTEESVPVETLAVPHRKSPLPTPQASEALPIFPLPALPNPPSKSALALQGLDKVMQPRPEWKQSGCRAKMQDQDRGNYIRNRLRGQGNDAGTGLSQKMRKRLLELGITELLLVHIFNHPFISPSHSFLSSNLPTSLPAPPNPFNKALYQPYNPPRNVCILAPMGSGKTLVYVVPIVEILSSHIVTRIRTLIILPTCDLVMQVHEMFEAVNKGQGLKIGTATGQDISPVVSLVREDGHGDDQLMRRKDDNM